MGDQPDPKLRKEHLRKGSDGCPGDGFAGASAFEYVARIREVVLEHARKVGMPRARARQLATSRGAFCTHDVSPLLPLTVVDGYSYGASDGEPAAHARYYFEIIFLDLHA